MASDLAWEKIYTESGMCEHDFSVAPFILTADEIKRICHGFANKIHERLGLRYLKTTTYSYCLRGMVNTAS